MGIIDSVGDMQADVLSDTESIFNQIQSVAQSAVGIALNKMIEANVSASTSVDEPDDPVPGITFEDIIADLERLERLFLVRPILPPLNATPPNLPDIDTTPPDLADVDLPAPIAINIPTFDETLDLDDVNVPTVTFEYSENAYSSVLRDALYNLLLTEVENGDYGLDENDEMRLFQRAREREQAAAMPAIEQATRLFSSAGFQMPNGAAAAAIAKAQMDVHDKVSSINRELMIKRGDLYAEMKKVTYGTTMDMEKTLLEGHNTFYERQLKAAAQRITSVLEISNFELARIKALADRYKVMADVFETLVRAEGLKVDLYGKQIDAAKAQIEFNRLLLEEFITRNKAIIEVFLGQVEEYKAKVDGWSKHIGALADIYRADAAAFGAAADAYGKKFEVSWRQYDGTVAWKTAQLNSRVQEAKFVLDEAIADAQIELEGEKAMAQVAAQVASAALSALNVSASVGANAGSSMSFNGSVTESTSENTNYNISVEA